MYNIICIYNIYYFCFRKYLYTTDEWDNVMNNINGCPISVGPLIIDTCHRHWLIVFSYKYGFHCNTNHAIKDHNTIF